MKRLNDKIEGEGEGEGEHSGLKRSRFISGVDEISRALARSEAEDEIVFAENGFLDCRQVGNGGDFFGNIVHDEFAGPSLGGLDLNETNKWDFDINFDLIFGNGEEQKGLGVDLNVPAPGRGDRGKEKGIMINENKVEIIDITSDDSDDDVEILACGIGREAKGKQIEVGFPYDGMENLALGLGTINNNVVGESSSMAGAERIHGEVENGKASVVHPWLTLNIDYPNDLDFWPDQLISEIIEDVYVPTSWRQPPPVPIPWQPPPAPRPMQPPPVPRPWQAPPVPIPMQPPPVPRPMQPPPMPRPMQPPHMPRPWQAPPIPVRLNFDEQRQNEQATIIRRTYTSRTMRETAKRFARINHPDESNGVKPVSQKTKPVGSKTAEQFGVSRGPFSEALRIVRERTFKRDAEQLIEWKPSLENEGRSPTLPLVPSLLDLSVKALAENADGIVSLELVPDFLRKRLVDVLCDTGKMNANLINLLVNGSPTAIRIKNCSWITEKQFQQSFGNCQTENLKVLQLDLGGQCMFDFVFKDTLARSSNRFSRLAIVSLRGACRLSDSGVKALVMSAPALRSINLGHCTLLTCDAINFIADSLGSNLRELYIDDCQKINAILILPGIKRFTCLEVLSVAGVPNVTDQFISEMVTVCGQTIKELDLAGCLELTDWSLKLIASSCTDLLSLNISNLNLTDLGMEYLGNGCRSIQKLKLSRGEFSDEAVAAFLDASGESLVELLLNNVTKVGPNTAFSLAKRSRKLLYLDISWCRKISNEALGLIVDCCSKLRLLKVFGCRQITSIFLSGHSNPTVQIIGLKLTPIMDHLNLLEPEEVFLRYSPLPICTEN